MRWRSCRGIGIVEGNLYEGNFPVIREAVVEREKLQGADEELITAGKRSVEVRDDGAVKGRGGRFGELNLKADELFTLPESGRKAEAAGEIHRRFQEELGRRVGEPGSVQRDDPDEFGRRREDFSLAFIGQISLVTVTGGEPEFFIGAYCG